MILKAIPQLPSMNFKRSIDFYCNKLCFQVTHQYDDLIILHADEIEIHLWLCHDPLIAQSSSAYFRVTMIDEFYEQCDRLGVVHPNAHLEDKPWGIKEFYAVDPDGNLLKFGQSSFQ
jgi:catechol 2,3-dioxygenase-like lactoylglutathione lyase family enzyme